MSGPYGESAGSGLPPSKFGAGFTVGGGITEPPPVYGYPAPEPPAPGAVHYPPPPVHYPPVPQYGVAMVPAARTNSMAIAALVCSLVLAPLGIVFGHIALSQINRTGEDGRGLAIAGLIIGYIFTAIGVLWLLMVFVFIGAFTTAVTTPYDSDYTYSMAILLGSGAGLV